LGKRFQFTWLSSSEPGFLKNQKKVANFYFQVGSKPRYGKMAYIKRNNSNGLAYNQ